MEKNLTILQFTAIITYESGRTLSDILTEIRAVKGVTIVNVIKKSEKLFNNNFFQIADIEQRDIFRTILLVKVEISKLKNLNIQYYLKSKIAQIGSIKNCIIKIGNLNYEP